MSSLQEVLEELELFPYVKLIGLKLKHELTEMIVVYMQHRHVIKME